MSDPQDYRYKLVSSGKAHYVVPDVPAGESVPKEHVVQCADEPMAARIVAALNLCSGWETGQLQKREVAVRYK